jgi:capsule polysaccharide export protein KpsC/LpsZ
VLDRIVEFVGAYASGCEVAALGARTTACEPEDLTKRPSEEAGVPLDPHAPTSSDNASAEPATTALARLVERIAEVVNMASALSLMDDVTMRGGGITAGCGAVSARYRAH